MMIMKHLKGTPSGLNDGETRSLFDAVRAGMGVKKKKEVKVMADRTSI